MPFGLVALHQLAHAQIQHAVILFQSLAHILVHGRFADAEGGRRSADGRVVFDDVCGQITGPLLDACMHSRHSPCAACAARFLLHLYEPRPGDMRAAPRPAQAGGIVCVTAAVRTADNRKSKRLSSFEGFLLSALPGHDILASAKETGAGERARRLGRRQVLIGPFPPILHRKIRKYVKYSRIFLFCLDEKSLAQNCFARKKIDFCVGQGEKRRNTGYVFRAFSTKSGAKRSFLRWTYPYSARPKAAVPIFLRKNRGYREYIIFLGAAGRSRNKTAEEVASEELRERGRARRGKRVRALRKTKTQGA